jgi:hypothetical protein
MKGKRRRFTIEECARHEAGHVVAQIAFGRAGAEQLIATVLDEPDATGSLGYVEHYPGQHELEAEAAPVPRKRRAIRKELWEEDAPLAHLIDEGDRLHLARNLIILHAGAAAQFPRAPGYSLDPFLGAGKDMRGCDLAAWDVGYWPPHQWDYAYFAAVEAIDARFGELMALARALAKRRRLMGAEMLEIIARAPKHRNPHREQLRWPGSDAPDHFLAEALLTWRDHVIEEPIVERAAAMSEADL